ncbi:MAG TPA: YceI family protein [Flavobacteriales bacterium]|jgi:hypothetical protein|nr:YceI family protein [Flavobacteriales bacterium]
MRTLILVLLFLVSLGTFAQSRMYVDRSEVSFVSDAPLEHITATNSACEGLLDPETRSFAIKVPITRFQGFNSPLQREHFNENYLVSRTYPDATFAGRIIETIDLNVSGSHVVRAKGRFTIHGVTMERIVPCKLVVAAEGVRVTTEFDVLLEDHAIRVPRIVNQKISPVVRVRVDVRFKPVQP